MQIYGKTVPELEAEQLAESLRRLETFLTYFQETTDHQLALLRRKVEAAEVRAEVNTLKTQVQAQQAQGGTT